MKRARTILTWLLQILLAVVFLLVGLGKFQMWEGWASRFEMWGYAPWFLAVVAVLEATGGAAVLVPRAASYGAALLAMIMLGATYTHVSTGIGQPTGTAILATLCLAVVALRWPDRWGSA